MATVTRERRDDIAKLLTTLATPCGSSYSEHDWRKCPRCLLIEALSQRGGLVFDLLREGAAAIASPPAEDANRAKLAAAVLDVAQRLESCGVVGRDLHLRTCIGDEDTPCNCGADDPAEVLRGIAEALTWPPSRAQAPPASDPPGLVANWRPIETAPKRTDVLAGWADRPHWLPQVLQQDDAGMWFNGEESDYRPPTHWMPLPASPQAETKGDES